MDRETCETPESQRVTIPSPQPFAAVVARPRSVGEYRIVNERAHERAQRSVKVETTR